MINLFSAVGPKFPKNSFNNESQPQCITEESYPIQEAKLREKSP